MKFLFQGGISCAMLVFRDEKILHFLKLTACTLKNNGWKMMFHEFSFWAPAYFQEQDVSFGEGFKKGKTACECVL